LLFLFCILFVKEMGEDRLWVMTYFPVAWSAHICQGLCKGIFGPTQPYLAQNLGVQNKDINFIWTLGALGSCMATVFTGVIFKDYLKERNLKLLFLCVCVLLAGVFIATVPFVPSFSTLLLAVLLAGVFLGSLSTASNSLVLFMLGPDRSPPYTQSLHAFVALGFVLGSLLVRPFLPQWEEQSEVCGDMIVPRYNHSETVENDHEEKELSSITSISWPFIIIGVLNFLTALAFLLLIVVGIPMPRFYESIAKHEVDGDGTLEEGKTIERAKHQKTLLVFAFFYFAFTCGIEGFFQSQTFTFGICGPHRMEPEKAASLTTVYFASFLVGRFSGVLLSTRFRPQSLILSSLTCCILTGILLIFLAESYQEVLFIATGAMGFSVSLQFASGYSWFAEKTDLTGRASSIVFLGANAGWVVFPPLAGSVFFSPVGPMGIFYLSLGLSSLHLLLFLAMLKLATF